MVKTNLLSGIHKTPPDSAVVPPNTGSFSSTMTSVWPAAESG
ncbi:hypothetical protein AWB81_08593 [Caballeronia arationis]|nr:hypothetical protein AWB81_08593 [Caballeronia arationis]